MATWTIITNGSIDEDSPLTTTLFTSFRDNIEYLHERAGRFGTHATGVRQAVAMGSFSTGALSWSSIITSEMWKAVYGPGSVVFSSAADDGDPNFTSAPHVFVQAEEDKSSSAIDWQSSDPVYGIYIPDGTITSSQFQIEAHFHSSTNPGSDMRVTFHWLAIGPVTSGE